MLILLHQITSALMTGPTAARCTVRLSRVINAAREALSGLLVMLMEFVLYAMRKSSRDCIRVPTHRGNTNNQFARRKGHIIAK